MMILLKRVPTLALFTLIAAFGLTGCADTFTGSEARHAETGGAAKLRHAHLLDRALKTASPTAAKGASNSGSNSGPRMGLVMGMGTRLETQRIANRYRITHRYKVADRYKVAIRYIYTHVFEGLAVEVEDSLAAPGSTGDFQEFFDSLNVDPGITWYEPDIAVDIAPTAAALEPGTGEQHTSWSIDRIGGIGDENSGVDVFVLDTGVSNSDLHVVESVDFTGSPSGTADIDGHGTHVAGTIAAIDDGDGVVGLAPGARIHSLKVLPDEDPNPNDDEVDLSAAIAAVEHATGQKLANPNVPMVVNISLGADVGTTAYNALDEAIAASSGAGVVYIVAAGNEGIDAATVTPAHTAEAITVGAYDADDRFSAFSNYGAVVDILAPGVDVVSLDRDGETTDPVKMSGTSMATAHVTGAVTLFLGQNPQASPAQVSQALVASGLARIADVPQGTTNKTVYIGDLMDVQVSPFYHYAIAADDDLKIDAPLTVAYDGPDLINANLFSNHDIDVEDGNVMIEGFAYAHDEVETEGSAGSMFQPRLNPTNLAVYQEDLDKIDIPDFRPQDYQHLATQQSSGDVNLAGHYTLGTAIQPVVWYIDGKLKTQGDVSFSGYGVLLVKDDVEIKHNVAVLGNTGDTSIGIYTGKKFTVKKDAGQVSLVGHLVAREDVVIEGAFQLTGSIAAGKKAEFKRGNDGQGGAVVYYRAPSAVLTNLIWPMTSNREQDGSRTARGRRLISRF